MTLKNYMILGDYVSLVLISFFYFILFTNKAIDEKIVNKLKIIANLFFILICSDTLEYVCSDINTSSAITLRYIATTIGYLFRPCSMMFAISAFLKLTRNKKIYLYTPFLINALGLTINIFYPLMFRYDGTVFVRKSAGYLTHIVSGIYLIAMIITMIKSFEIVNKNEKILFAITGLVITGAVTIETVLGLYFVSNSVSIASAIFYYMYLYSNTSKMDSLTGLFNRNTFFDCIEQYLDESFVVITIDINDFKRINDILGHLQGDRTLEEIAKIIRKNLLPRCSAYRIGGDEFIIICRQYKINEVENMIKDILLQVEERNYSVAYGVAQYEKDMDLNEVLKKSENLMYLNKREIKRKI